MLVQASYFPEDLKYMADQKNKIIQLLIKSNSVPTMIDGSTIGMSCEGFKLLIDDLIKDKVIMESTNLLNELGYVILNYNAWYSDENKLIDWHNDNHKNVFDESIRRVLISLLKNALAILEAYPAK